MVNLLRILPTFYLFSLSMLLFISLAALPTPALFLIQAALAPCLWAVFVIRVFKRNLSAANFIFPWFALFLSWLFLQQCGIWLGMPFFKIPSSWSNWLDVFALFLTGFGIYLITQEALSSRPRLVSFLKYFVSGFSATALYFVFIFYTAGVAVERIQPPFPLLRHLQPWSAAVLQPNNLVDLFIPAFFYALSFAFYSWRRRVDFIHPAKAYVQALLYLCFVCVLAAGILFTKSRAGILAFSAAAGIYFILFAFSHRRRGTSLKALGVLLAVVILFLLSLGLSEVLKELQTISATVNEEMKFSGARSMTIGATWQIIQKRGLLGVGLGNFAMGWLLNHATPFYVFPARSYNDFLWLWAEGGLFGLFFFSSLIVIFLGRNLSLAFRTDSQLIKYLLLASSCSLMAFCFHSLVDPTFYSPALFWCLSVVMGLAGACHHLEQAETMQKASAKIKSPFFKILAWVLILAVATVVSGIFARKLKAMALSRDPITAESLLEASRLDFSNSYYLYQLALLYRLEYEKDPSPEKLMRALDYIDAAIDRTPFSLSYYRQRAEILFAAGEEAAVKKTFEMMRERLPDFYLAELTATVFYVEASVQANESRQADDFAVAALRHYLRALELNPQLSKAHDFYPQVSVKARKRFDELLAQKTK